MFLASILLLLLFAGLGIAYYRLQKKVGRIGGAISMAKAFWLAYALFNYLGLSLYLLIVLPQDMVGYLGLLTFTSLIYTRTIIQGIMMFRSKNWKPPYGIISNLLVALVLVTFLGLGFLDSENTFVSQHIIHIFIVKLTAILLCDSYYAFLFYRIVGDATIGEQAVWFAASEDTRFDFVNRLTFRLNFVFCLLTSIFLAMLIIFYG